MGNLFSKGKQKQEIKRPVESHPWNKKPSARFTPTTDQENPNQQNIDPLPSGTITTKQENPNQQNIDPYYSENRQNIDPLSSENQQNIDPYYSENQQNIEPLSYENQQNIDPYSSENQQNIDPLPSVTSTTKQEKITQNRLSSLCGDTIIKEFEPEDFNFESIRFRHKDSKYLYKIFVDKFQDNLKQNKIEIEWVKKCWPQFLKKRLNAKKRLWSSLRRDQALQNYPVLPDEDDYDVGKRKTAMNSFLNCHYQKEYEEEVLFIKSILESSQPEIFQEFYETYKIFTDPVAAYNEYFNWPTEITLEDVEKNILPLHFQWFVDSNRARGKTDLLIFETLKTLWKDTSNGLVVRVVISSIPQTKSLSTDIAIWFASRITPLGLNHTSLQVGPYFIHFTSSNLVTVHDIGNHEQVFALFYPDKTKTLNIHKDKDLLMNLCETMIKFNQQPYDRFSNNCQNFVDTALINMKWEKNWIKKGPIDKFLDHVSKLDTGREAVSFWDLDGKCHTSSNYQEFRNICKSDKGIVSLMNRKDMILVNGLTSEEVELLDILKAIERGYQIQIDCTKKTDDLLFPIEKSTDNTSGYTGETKFVLTMMSNM